MCRRMQFPGLILLSFGTGLMVGSLCGESVICIVIGVFLVLFGVLLGRQC